MGGKYDVDEVKRRLRKLLLTLSAAEQVRGPARDLHSGNDGGVFNEPLADLTKVPLDSASS